MPKQQATAAIMAERVDAIAERLIKGETRAEILRADPYGLSVRQYDRLLERATEQLAESAAANRPALVGTAYRRYNAVYNRAFQAGNLRDAITAQDRIVTLFALQTPPPARTLNLNVDAAQLETLLSAIESSGLSAGDVFAAMIAELASEPIDMSSPADEECEE